MEFRDRQVLVTGASAGIGLEFARQFHELGARVTLVARRAEVLKNVVDELNRKREGSATMLVIDLADTTGRGETSLHALVEHVKANRVDILVNNAGRGTFGRFEQLEPQGEIDMINLNVVATTLLAHAVIPQMKERRDGAIIAVSSVAAFQPMPYMATYAGTKAFNFNHGLALHHELSEYGIRVVTLCPGPTRTEFAHAAEVPSDWSVMFNDSAAMVVGKTVRGLQRNASVVVPGWRAGMMALAAKLMPRSLSTFVTKQVLVKAVRGR